MSKDEGKCAIIGAPCPRTSNRAAKRYCPAWSDEGIGWQQEGSSYGVVRHCAFENLGDALLHILKASDTAAQSSQRTTTAVACMGAAVAGVAEAKFRTHIDKVHTQRIAKEPERARYLDYDDSKGQERERVDVDEDYD